MFGNVTVCWVRSAANGAKCDALLSALMHRYYGVSAAPSPTAADWRGRNRRRNAGGQCPPRGVRAPRQCPAAAATIGTAVITIIRIVIITSAHIKVPSWSRLACNKSSASTDRMFLRSREPRVADHEGLLAFRRSVFIHNKEVTPPAAPSRLHF